MQRVVACFLTFEARFALRPRVERELLLASHAAQALQRGRDLRLGHPAPLNQLGVGAAVTEVIDQ